MWKEAALFLKSIDWILTRILLLAILVLVFRLGYWFVLAAVPDDEQQFAEIALIPLLILGSTVAVLSLRKRRKRVAANLDAKHKRT